MELGRLEKSLKEAMLRSNLCHSSGMKGVFITNNSWDDGALLSIVRFGAAKGTPVFTS